MGLEVLLRVPSRILKNKDLYPTLHRAVFGKDVETPEVVIVHENERGAIVGFVSGHWELDGTFYIEFAGVLPMYQKKGYLRYIKKILDPCVNYLTAVENTNTVTGKTMYALGFIPIGSRYHDDKFYIEWLRRGVKNG